MDSNKRGTGKNTPYLNVGACFNEYLGVRTLSFVHPFTHKPFVLLTDVKSQHVWGAEERQLYLENINDLLELYAHEKAEPYIGQYEAGKVGKNISFKYSNEALIQHLTFKKEFNWLTNLTMQRHSRCMRLLNIVII